MKYELINNQLFKQNRANFIKQMEPNSIAIFHANDQLSRNGDATHKFRQNSDLFYLTGVDQEKSVLVLYPDAPVAAWKEMLFIIETNEHIAVWEGEKLTKEKAEIVSGISAKNTHWNKNDNWSILTSAILTAENIYLNTNENDRAETGIDYKDIRFINEIKQKFPLHNLKRSAPIMAKLRAIKSDLEIELMQTACNITEKAFRQVMNFVKPGVMEYEVEAEIIGEFIRNRANGHAYEPIVASGANACVLHYNDNNMVCNDGDLLLMDFGAEYANYAADLTRTIPVNGKFTERQKAVYNACLKVHKEGVAMLRPGITLNQYNKEVRQVMKGALIDLGLIDKAANEQEQNKLTQKYFPHGTGHFLGLDVHDIGNRYALIENNMCFTVEPGIYIREEGIGIRIENDIIVREGGNLDLMKNIPIEVDDIESLMNE